MIHLLRSLSREFTRAELIGVWYPAQRQSVVYSETANAGEAAERIRVLAEAYFAGDEPTQTRHVIVSAAKGYDALVQLPGGPVLLVEHDSSVPARRVVATVNDYVLSHGLSVPTGAPPTRQAVLAGAEEEALAAVAQRAAAVAGTERQLDRQLDAMIAAQRSQNQLLSDVTPIRRYVQELAVYYQPKDFVGGDFYYFLPTEDGFCYALADYTGHGVQGALGAMMCVSLLNQIVAARVNITPTQVMLRLHQGLTRMVGNSNDKANQQPGLEIVFGQYVATTRRMQVCSAGIDTLLLREGEAIELPRMRYAVGSPAFSVTGLSTYEHVVEPNDVLVAYTDGVKDQLEHSTRRRIGRRTVHELIKAHSNGTFGHLTSALRESLTAWRGHLDQTDDTTLIGLKF